MSKKNLIDLNTFAGGALAEQVSNELQNIINNIDDPNTAAVVARKLTIEITIKPNQRRKGAAVIVNAKSKLAPVIPVETNIIIDRDVITGKVMTAEIGNQVPGQLEMDLEEIDTPQGQNNVLDLKKINNQNNKEVANQ